MNGASPFTTENITSITPLGMGFTALMCLLLIFLPRKYALVPVIILVCNMTMGERVAVAGLNFTMFRILILVGWVRMLVRGEIKSFKLNAIDKTLIWLMISSVITHVLLWQTYGAFQNKLGQAYNAIGLYFLFRFLLRDTEDIVRLIKVIAWCVIPLAGFMITENLTGHNLFAVFGGVPESTSIRLDTLRVQGPFSHPILAGTFGATLLPLFVGLWKLEKGNRKVSMLAIVSCVAITLTSASSGPLLAFFCGLLAMAAWPLRNHFNKLRWGLLIALVGLELVMKSHIWFLMARVNVFSGSTGFHRAYLIDRAIANLDDWWLIGTKSTAAWADQDAHLFDVTNQYIAYGADGGLITMLLFILVIVHCFRAVGLTVRGLEPESPNLQICIWALGAALFCHTVTFLSVSYFDQNFVNWYLLLAMISTVSESAKEVRSKGLELTTGNGLLSTQGRTEGHCISSDRRSAYVLLGGIYGESRQGGIEATS